jgi:hypothetical protein
MLIAIIKKKKIFPIEKRQVLPYLFHPPHGTLLEY